MNHPLLKSVPAYIICLFFLLNNTFAQIQLDEDFGDWQQVPLQFSDARGDGSGIDFIRFAVSSDSDHLYTYIELDREINLQDNNNISIFLDTDNNINTGAQTSGIGADLIYTFGEREGTYVRTNGTNVSIRHDDIGMISLPTVTSDKFEIAIRRDIVVANEQVFRSDSVRVAFRNQQSNGDIMPNNDGGLIHRLQQGQPSTASYTLDKQDSSHLRILSYNVLRDGFWDNQQAPALRRIINAIHPDLIGFQEIYDRNANETASLVSSILMNKYNQGWYQAKTGPDVICVSKFPILGSYPVAGNGAFHIDMGSYELLFFVAHPPCCSNDQGRQDEIDAMMAFIRDAKAGTGPLTLAPNSPIVIVGDMNLVGLNEQRTTMLTGDIKNNSIYGSDFTPDWNGQSLVDASPFATGLPMTVTWYNERSAFAPGRLDYLVYSGSNMELMNSYNLFTRTMSTSELTAAGLQREDAIEASDHLPVVGDFRITLGPPASLAGQDDPFSLGCYPNPIQGLSSIRYSLPTSAPVELSLLDHMGRRVHLFSQNAQSVGTHSLAWDARGMAAGLYVLRLEVEGIVSRVKVMVQ